MDILVLGGTVHVGRAVVSEALAAGHTVTALNRGVTGTVPDQVEHLAVDRTDRAALTAALAGRSFDLVVDTWSQAPRVVTLAAQVCEPLAPRYVYVSSRSVYTWPMEPGVDESAPVVQADADADVTDYAADKRGGELGVLRVFGQDRCLLARAGLILGPWEHVGRMPWWLARLAKGGDVVAPGPADRSLQYVDCRDLARYLLTTTATGAVDTVSAPAHATIGELLTAAVDVTGAEANLVWATPELLAEHGITGWVDLPIWTPPTGELAALHESDTSLAASTGLVCRPIAESMRACWDWLQAEGWPVGSKRAGELGISAETERQILGALAAG